MVINGASQEKFNIAMQFANKKFYGKQEPVT